MHFCLNNTPDNTYPNFNAEIVDAVMTLNYNGGVGIGNTNPLDDGGITSFLCIGDSSVTESIGALVIGRRNSSGATRQMSIRYDGYFNACFGDYGLNNTVSSFSPQIAVSWAAPTYSIQIASSGQVIMPSGWTTSDERIKTNIKTIEHALDKILLLRGVE